MLRTISAFRKGCVFEASLVAQNLPGGSDGKESARNVGDPGLIPGSERTLGEGHGNPLQYSCLENSMDRGAWWATISTHTHTHTHIVHT